MSEFEDALDEAVENGEITEAEARADLISRQAATSIPILPKEERKKFID